MKICFITSTIFNLGGVQRVLSVIASELVNHYEVDILCTDDNFKVNRELYNLNSNINIHMDSGLLKRSFIDRLFSKPLNFLNRELGLLNNNVLCTILSKLYYTKEIKNRFVKYLNLNDYDIVIGVEGYYSLLLGIIANTLNAKTIGWQHNSYDAYLNNKKRYYWQQDALFRKYLPNLDRCIVLTKEDGYKYKEKLKVDCDVIYNPLSFESEKKSECNNKSIIFVGRLVEQQKGLDLLIKAFSLVNKEKKDWILKIVGDGPDKGRLIDCIKEYNLQNNVILLGKSDNVKQHYLNSSIFVSSSRWEGFGLVITEAMECGVPVIAFENSGPKEIINKKNENGILVPCRDVNILAEKIIDLIKNEEKRKRMAKRAAIRAQDFSINKIYKEWNRILQSLKN